MMLEKGIADQYEENIVGMLGKGEQKSWRQLRRIFGSHAFGH